MNYIVPKSQTNILVQHREDEARKVYEEMVGRACMLHDHVEEIPGPLCLEIAKVKYTDAGIRVEPTPEYQRIQEELRQGREAMEKLKVMGVEHRWMKECLIAAGLLFDRDGKLCVRVCTGDISETVVETRYEWLGCSSFIASAYGLSIKEKEGKE